ncbi:MAG: hypothetical protein Q8L37_02790 [Candidatus Gottesmanbacteria bacterium]|nr:hypothetical protein [Candidatus Gottesmanbacteria bacterium]
MVQFFVSLGWYLLTALIHVILHRALALGFGKLTKNSFLIFIPSAMVIGWLLYFKIPGTLPMSALFLFLLFSGAHFLFFMSFFFDARSPSMKVLFLVRRHGPITREEILTHFSDAETVVNRVNTLLYEKFLVEGGNRLHAAPKAIPIARFMTWYRRLMKWERGG